jgi:hypothetical protein
MVTGSVFRISALLFLFCVVVAEAIVLTSTSIWGATLWALINLGALQFGYLAGVFGRGLLEKFGISLSPVNIRWP